MSIRGLGRLYRRGPVWWIQYSHRGRRVRESSRSTVRSDAARLLKKRMAEIGHGRLLGPNAERTTFEDLAQMLFEDYRLNGRKSLERVQNAVDHLRDYFGRFHAVDITTDRMTAYAQSRLEDPERPAKPATVRNELAALGRMFTLAARAGKVHFRPHIPSIDVRNTRSGFFEEPEFRAVLAELPRYARLLVEFAYLTGWRIGEVLSLTWRQVDFLAGIVRLEPGTTKNDEGRAFPFEALPALATLLRTQRERTSELERERGQLIPWVFHRHGKPIHSFRDAWLKACERAGVQGRLVHDLRRTAVRNLERAGVPRSWAMKLTGHKTESIYRRYAIVSEADLAEGVRRLAALRPSTGSEPRRVVPLSGGDSPRKGTIGAQSGEFAESSLADESAELLEAVGAGGGGRTRTRCEPNRILSPARLPVPPLRHEGNES